MRNEMTDFKTEIHNEMADFKTESNNEMNSFKDDIYNKFDSFGKELCDVKNRLQNLENAVTVIEKEHGEKLDLLLDYASGNIQKHGEYDKNFKKIDSKLFDHDVRIAIVQDFVDKCKKKKLN